MRLGVTTMDDNQKGVSVKEIENFTRKYTSEVFFIASLVLACIFSWAFFGTGWALILATIGGIIGILMSSKVDLLLKKVWHFIYTQERTVQIIIGVVMLIISVFIPPVTFFFLGLGGGKGLFQMAMETKAQHKKE